MPSPVLPAVMRGCVELVVVCVVPLAWVVLLTVVVVVVGAVPPATMPVAAWAALVSNCGITGWPALNAYPPSTPMSVLSSRVTCAKSTLIRTCGLGRSRLRMTLRISSWVCSSATITSERLSGSIWIRASPSWVLFRYCRAPEADPEDAPPPPARLPPAPPVAARLVEVVAVRLVLLVCARKALGASRNKTARAKLTRGMIIGEDERRGMKKEHRGHGEGDTENTEKEGRGSEGR